MSKKTLDPQVQAAVDALQTKVTTDPQIRAYIAQTMSLVKGDPNSDANKALMSQRSKDLTALVKSKGLLPTNGQYTLDPSNGNLVRHGGWNGLSGLEKTAIVAAAAATGIGGAAALGAFGGGAAAAGLGGGAASASAAAPAATVGATTAGAGLAGLATPAVTAGLGGTGLAGGGVAAGTGIAGLLSRTAKTLQDASTIGNTVNSALHGGADPRTQGLVAGSMADQAAINRYKDTQVNQNGPSADALSLTNIRRAGKIANYTPPDAATQALLDKYHKTERPPDAATIAYAKQMETELQRRMAAGEPLTLSGVPAAGAQETADNAAARKAALAGPNGTGVLGGIAAGSQLAKLAPTFADLFKNLGGSNNPNTTPIKFNTPTPTKPANSPYGPDYDYGDQGDY